eukprot:5259641-Lingulodinium_polyedra.AAC.1
MPRLALRRLARCLWASVRRRDCWCRSRSAFLPATRALKRARAALGPRQTASASFFLTHVGSEVGGQP